ncbi:hypothetical protein BGW80DRAFT_1447916 [Lactifluus volemus]|nr:hypothetical protein BGW80DRAFT_1447916 [Lactifluus volemus]
MLLYAIYPVASHNTPSSNLWSQQQRQKTDEEDGPLDTLTEILACSGRVRDWQSARDADEPASVSPANDASLATIAPVLNCLVLAFEGSPADRCDAHADASAVDARFARTTRRFGPAYRRTGAGGGHVFREQRGQFGDMSEVGDARVVENTGDERDGCDGGMRERVGNVGEKVVRALSGLAMVLAHTILVELLKAEIEDERRHPYSRMFTLPHPPSPGCCVELENEDEDKDVDYKNELPRPPREHWKRHSSMLLYAIYPVWSHTPPLNLRGQNKGDDRTSGNDNGTPAVCGGALARSTDTLLARTTRRPRPVHRRATSHRVSGVEAREFATDEDDFVEVFLPGWFTCGPGSPGTGAVSKSRL